MESLAVVVAILFLIAMIAGPIAIGLSSDFLVDALKGKSGIAFAILRFFRKTFHIIFVTLGTLVGFQFLIIPGLPFFPRAVGATAVVTSYIGLRREYFPDVFLIRNLWVRLGIRNKPQPPIFSADGTEIIPAKKSRRLGRTQGRDGHGPAGQH